MTTPSQRPATGREVAAAVAATDPAAAAPGQHFRLDITADAEVIPGPAPTEHEREEDG